MKFLVVLLLVGAAAAQQAQFETKFKNLVTDYLGANTPKAMNMVCQDILAQKTIEDVMAHLMKEIIGLVPANKYMGALGMLTSFTSCMKASGYFCLFSKINVGSTMEAAMANIGAAFTAKLTPLYKTVMTKVKTMKTNKKPDAAICTEGFKIATAGLTKALVQSVINQCMTKSTKPEYECALPALKTVMKTDLYNVVYDAKRGMFLGINRFHWIALLTWQCMNFFAGSNLFPVFSNYMPEWRCGSGLIGKNCSAYKTCSDRQETVTYTHVTFHSSAYEFQWFCDGAKFANISTQVQFFGYFFGTLLFGFASDILGRKLVATFAVALGIAATMASALLHSAYPIFVARFCIGLGIGGQMVVGCTFIMELLLPEQRMFARSYFNWGISRMLLTTICYLTQEWRAACFGIALCSMPALLACLFIFPESPTWLLSKGRLDEMRESEKKIAKIAGVQYMPINHPIPEKSKSLCAVMKSGLWKRLIVLWTMWFTAATSSYATDLASSRLSGNLYMNQFMFGLVTYVSKIILGIVDSRCPAFSRRILHQGAQFFAIACFGALAVFKLVGYNGPLMLVLNILGIVFVEYTWDACYLCAIEGVETSSRASATGSSSFIARIGMLISPLLAHIDVAHPGTVYIVVVVLGSQNLLQSYLFLVETKGVKLDEVTVDGHEVRREEDEELQGLKQ